MDIIREALEIDPTSKTGLRWKWRPREHFATEHGWKIFNGRDAGNEAGTRLCPYFNVGICGLRLQNHRIVFALSTGVDPGNLQIDHIDNDGSNNDPTNLRLATNLQNSRNRGAQKNNTSGRKGVAWHDPSQKWRAEIAVNGKKRHLGLFESVDAASAAYEAAAREVNGEFYREEANA